MFEPHPSRPPAAPAVPSTAGFRDDEPQAAPRRHPAWADVPQAQWDDWRWQTQNSVRSVRQLRHLLAFTPDELAAIGELERDYKVAIPPYYFSLIDPADAADPIRLAVGPVARSKG